MKASELKTRDQIGSFLSKAAVLGLCGGIIGTLCAWAIDAMRTGLAYRFILKPQGASFGRLLLAATLAHCRRYPVCTNRFQFGRTLPRSKSRSHRPSESTAARLRGLNNER